MVDWVGVSKSLNPSLSLPSHQHRQRSFGEAAESFKASKHFGVCLFFLWKQFYGFRSDPGFRAFHDLKFLGIVLFRGPGVLFWKVA